MLDEENRRFVTRNEYINLTNKEAQCLEYFISNKHQALQTDVIAKELLQTSKLASARNIICRLNKKLTRYVRVISFKKIGYKIKYIGE